MSDEHLRAAGHLDAMTLAAFVDGRADTAERARIEAHLAECEDCYEAFVDVTAVTGEMAGEAVAAVPTPAPVSASRPPSRMKLFVAAAAVLLIASIGVTFWWLRPDRRVRAATAALARAETGARFAQARLSLEERWVKPPAATRGIGRDDSPLSVRDALVQLERLAERSRSTRVLHGLGLGYLAAGRIDDSIGALEEALAEASATDIAAVRADLAAALVERSTTRNDPSDASRAADQAARALLDSPGYLPAQFNRALAFEVLGPPALAVAAWEDYLKLDPSSEWSTEARSRLDRLKKARERSAVGATFLFYRIQDDILPAWSREILGGVAAPTESLRQALDDLRTHSTDRQLPDLLTAALASAQWPSQRRRCLAEGIEAMADWRQAYERVLEAGQVFAARAREGFRCAGIPIAAADAAFALSGDRNKVFDSLAGIAAAAEAHRYQRVAALVLVSRGNSEIRRANFGSGLRNLQDARSAAQDAGDDELVATADAMMADAYRQHGDWDDVWRSLQRALIKLDGVRSQRLTYSVVRASVAAALEQGLTGAALRYMDLLVTSTAGWQNPSALIVARLDRADALHELNRDADAPAELAAARRLVEDVTDPALRSEFEAEVKATEGRVIAARSPEAGISALSSALTYFETHGSRLRFARVLLDRGRAYRSLGRQSDATRDWERCASLIEDQQPSVFDEQLRVSRFSKLWDVFAELIEARQQDPALALETAERARARELLDSIASGTEIPTVSGPALWEWLPPGVDALVYSVLPGKLLRWSVNGRGVTLDIVAVSSATLETLVTRSVAAVRSGTDGRLSELATLLLPANLALSSERELLIVPDGPLHQVPFATLRAPGHKGKRLVEVSQPVLAPSLNVARILASRQRRTDDSVLLVGVSTSSIAGDLPPLPGVQTEIDALVRLYPAAAVLRDMQATPPAVLSQLSHAALIHVASHAVLNQAFPSRSRIVLGAGPEGDSLTPGMIAARTLPKHPVVVLSACDTAAGRIYRGEGQLSLARPFLAAGAVAVIAAAWRLKDDTAPMLIEAVHQGLRAKLAPALALAQAQRRAIATQKPLADWAAFSVIGSVEPVH